MIAIDYSDVNCCALPQSTDTPRDSGGMTLIKLFDKKFSEHFTYNLGQ